MTRDGSATKPHCSLQRLSTSTLYCLVPEQFTLKSALHIRLGAYLLQQPMRQAAGQWWSGGSPVPISSTKGCGTSPVQNVLPSTGMAHGGCQAHGGCHTCQVTPSSQEHTGTLPGHAPRHAGISPVLPCSQEELIELPAPCSTVRNQSSCCHRMMHPVPCVSLTQEITKGSAFLPPKKAPRKKRGRRFPENLSVKV